jgi:hypothetical protein
MVPVITTVLAPLKYAVIDKTVELLNFLGVWNIRDKENMASKIGFHRWFKFGGASEHGNKKGVATASLIWMSYQTCQSARCTDRGIGGMVAKTIV